MSRETPSKSRIAEFFRSWGARTPSGLATHDWRRGLHSIAASRLYYGKSRRGPRSHYLSISAKKLAVFQRELFAAPDYRVSEEASNPDSDGDQIAQR